METSRPPAKIVSEDERVVSKTTQLSNPALSPEIGATTSSQTDVLRQTSQSEEPRVEAETVTATKPLIQEVEKSPGQPTAAQRTNRNDNEAGQRGKPSLESEHSSLPPPAQPYSPTRIPPTLATLEKLLRQSKTNPEVVHQTLFNLDAKRLPVIFGEFGLDTTLLNEFLDAILSINPNNEKWWDQSVALLDSLRKCGRFSIAHTFSPMDKITRVFERLEHNATGEQKARIGQVKYFWIQ